MVRKHSERKIHNQEIKESVSLIRRVYNETEIKIHKSSSLHDLIESAQVHVTQDEDPGCAIEYAHLFKALHVQRIAEGISQIISHENRSSYLRSLLQGTLDFHEREVSHAKSIFWELELCGWLRQYMPEAILDEPDIIISINGEEVAVPCKKLFSVRGISKVLSNAVLQFEDKFQFGVVAINLDDLVPGGAVLCKDDSKQVDACLHRYNYKFLEENQRHFRRYLDDSRIAAALICTHVISDTREQSPRFNNVSNYTIWTSPNLASGALGVIEKFREHIGI